MTQIDYTRVVDVNLTVVLKWTKNVLEYWSSVTDVHILFW